MIVADREVIYRRSLGACYLCGQLVRFDTFDVDHVVPRNRGGSNELSNLAATHRYCNRAKQDRLPDELSESMRARMRRQFDWWESA